jgi:1-acyl-sn-glycerol-3-phosphate acyltransferase
MFYRLFRTLFSLVLHQFFRIDSPVDPTGALKATGPVIFVGNHPNGLIDPGLVFILANRHVTFLAKAPLFTMPVLGLILRGLDALPVFRKQDGANTAANDSTLTASVEALRQGRAITIFPEGKSHSEPQLSALKTGCARIALEAVRQGAAVKIVPIGLTYDAKNRFKSRVHIEVAAAIDAGAFAEKNAAEAFEAAKALTKAIADSLRQVTLNLEHWEDLPLVETAESLYALKQGDEAGNAERQRNFAKGLALLRDEQPERFEGLKAQIASFRRRLDLVQISAKELTVRYRPVTVVTFALRNAVWLLGLPLFALGMVLFVAPYWVPIAVSRAMKSEDDVESTVKVLTLMAIAPLWWAVLTVAAYWGGGLGVAIAVLALTPALALFTRWYYERRLAAVRDARTFFVFWSRRRLKSRLLWEGELLSSEIDRVAQELRPRVIA